MSQPSVHLIVGGYRRSPAAHDMDYVRLRLLGEPPGMPTPHHRLVRLRRSGSLAAAGAPAADLRGRAGSVRHTTHLRSWLEAEVAGRTCTAPVVARLLGSNATAAGDG
jgi:hypothetical protein